MELSIHSGRRGAIARRTVLVLAIAGVGFAAGAYFHDSTSTGNPSVSFATPAQAAETRPEMAESSRRAQPTASGTVAPAKTADFGPPESERVQDPRECDVAKGIEYACMFMD